MRDKLLGQASNDLDVAVNILSGLAFAEQLQEYLRQNSQFGVPVAGIHTIGKNPDKSKHLETATTKLYGLDIDFVNLRSEEYTDESRIPVTQFGTPTEDALRRDATLNALFYNIQEESVEDLTQRGLDDLHAGILRTPLDPLKTFLDDPLRVLRLIRFAARFGFSLEENTKTAMSLPEVRQALVDKISRERVGTELAKTLESNAVTGLQLLCETNLLNVVFGFGSMENDVLAFNGHQSLNEYANHLSEHTRDSIERVKNLPASSVIDNVLTTYKRLFWAGTVVQPYGSYKTVINSKGKDQFACDVILKEGVKFSKVDAEILTRIISSGDAYQTIVSRLPSFKRSEIGLLLKPYGDHFDLAFVLNLSGGDDVTKHQQFYDLVKEQGLDQVHKLKPLVDGKTLSKRLGRKPGPWMSPLLEKILVWQLDHPQGSIDECLSQVS